MADWVAVVVADFVSVPAIYQVSAMPDSNCHLKIFYLVDSISVPSEVVEVVVEVVVVEVTFLN